MFEAVELGSKVSKQEFRDQEPALHTALLQAQRALIDAGVPVLLMVSGMEGTGRGALLNRLHKWLDTRDLRTEAFWDETDEERERPFYWRFWRRLPARGETAIFLGGWYGQPLSQRTFGELGTTAFDRALQRVAEMERMLSDDGMLILKFWLHVSRDTQKRRLKRQVEEGRRLTKQEKRFAKHYHDARQAAEDLIRTTDHGHSPWYLVEAEDERHRDLTVGRTLLEAMQRRLRRSGTERRGYELHNPSAPNPAGGPVSVLATLDLQQRLSGSDYREQFEQLRIRLNKLAWDAFEAGRSTVAVFEGWDAAGKGSAIRRIAAAVDARLLRVISTAAPSDEERAHHYLWRFWRHIPRAGHVTVYDRSWYGRVLVERVEGFAAEHEWMRAYQEINDFETQLIERGVVLVKFWLHITPEEQLARFEARQETPWKQHKLGQDDWRNREQWQAYEAAVNDMVMRTSTRAAPWHLIAANDKRHARIEVMRQLCRGLESCLG